MITIYLKQFNKIVRNADVKLFDELGYDDILWIDLLTPSIKEQKAVENFMEINLQTQQQVEEIESSSKYSETENAIICNSNFFMPYTETFAIEPVSFIIAEGVLVSVRNAEFRTFTEAAKRLQEAQAYREAVVNKAKGDAERFISVYNAYKQGKEITAKRLYLETMEGVLANSRKVILDPSAKGGNILPILPLNRNNQTQESK